jgi:hypothetical protein
MRGYPWTHLSVLLALAGAIGGQFTLHQALWITWGYLFAVCVAFAADRLD